ncbi:MAG: type II toxin-antitoxin system HicA family toxin [Myxococcota bacterium]|nr:type II toxin-antitoxin system HicA family toxin [Myxococcota bacterium]
MKRPRDLSAREIIRVLRPLGYRVTRQVGSHMRLTTEERGQHHITIPSHRQLTIGKINAMLWDVARHFGISREELMDRLFA